MCSPWGSEIIGTVYTIIGPDRKTHRGEMTDFHCLFITFPPTSKLNIPSGWLTSWKNTCVVRNATLRQQIVHVPSQIRFPDELLRTAFEIIWTMLESTSDLYRIGQPLMCSLVFGFRRSLSLGRCSIRKTHIHFPFPIFALIVTWLGAWCSLTLCVLAKSLNARNVQTSSSFPWPLAKARNYWKTK